MENKIKHLEFIQNVINRMSHCSFLIKGWCITIASALLALFIKEDIPEVLMVIVIPIFIFWVLDGFFLYQGRLYRSLYNEVRNKNEEQIDYNMNTKEFRQGRNTWLYSMFSKTLNILYLPLLLLVLLILILY